MPIVQIPTPMRDQSEGQAEVPVAGATVAEALFDLTAKYPGLQTKLFDATGALRAYVNVFVNDEDIRYLEELETALTESTVVALVPAVAGG
ncbi:MAG: MoaD/ThiS family protein [Gemmataceae bacterium]